MQKLPALVFGLKTLIFSYRIQCLCRSDKVDNVKDLGVSLYSTEYFHVQILVTILTLFS